MQVYVKITLNINPNFYIRAFCKQISSLYLSSDMPITSITQFPIYHLHYKNNFVSNLIQAFVCIPNYLYFLYNWSNFLVTFFFFHNSSVCFAKPGLVTKKTELTKTFLYIFFCFSLFSSFFFRLMFSKMRSAISKCSVILKCTTISEQQPSFLALANFSLLIDYLLVKLTSKKEIKKIRIMRKDYSNLTPIHYFLKTSFNYFLATQIIAQTVEFLLVNIALLNKQLRW